MRRHKERKKGAKEKENEQGRTVMVHDERFISPELMLSAVQRAHLPVEALVRRRLDMASVSGDENGLCRIERVMMGVVSTRDDPAICLARMEEGFGAV
jgi:hypothetical protein